MCVGVKGKLAESKVITIESIGSGMKDHIGNWFNSNSIITESQIFELRKKTLDMEVDLKDDIVVEDEEILLFAKNIEAITGLQIYILSDMVQAIFRVGDGSSHNKLIALEEIRMTLDIILIEVLKYKANKKYKGKSDTIYIEK